MNYSKVRWGIFGAGAISEIVVPDIITSERSEVTAVASRSFENARNFAEKHSISECYETYEELLHSSAIDAVYVATPIATHFRLAKLALEAGKHVVVEKSITVTSTEARELVELAKSKRLFLMEAMWMAFHPIVRKMVSEIEEGAIGDLTSVTAAFGIPFPQFKTSIWNQPGGGALLDLGIYPISLILMLLGFPESVTASGSVRKDGLDLTSAIYMKYPGNKFGHAMTSIDSFLNPVASIGGTKGFIAIDKPIMSTEEFRIVKPFDCERGYEIRHLGNGYVEMFSEVSQAILNGQIEHPFRTLEMSIRVLEIMEQTRSQLSLAD